MSDTIENPSLPFDQLNVSSGAEIEALFKKLLQRANEEAKPISSMDELEQFRIKWMGRKNSVLTRVRDNWLKPAPPESKKWVGTYTNWFKKELENVYGYGKKALETLPLEEGAGSAQDLSLPGIAARRGARHILTQTMTEICDIFGRIGFSVVEGPEVETPYYNFTALNIPPDHPAVDEMDSLYVEAKPGGEQMLLRTHTSPMQIRTMEKQKPPVRIVVPGKVYRRDNPDATHSFMFTQVEGLCVDKDITFADLKGSLEFFLHEFFGPEMKTRFCPTYFPFTEPSADVYGSCVFCSGAGCRVCKQTGWIEVLGSGMVDPAVFGFVGYDPGELSGFAFGIGVERFAMLKYGIDDIQLFFQNDVRFLRQFNR